MAPPTLNILPKTQTTPVNTPSNSAQNAPHPEITSQPDNTSDATESQVQINTATHTPHESDSHLPKLSLPNFQVIHSFGKPFGIPLMWQ